MLRAAQSLRRNTHAALSRVARANAPRRSSLNSGVSAYRCSGQGLSVPMPVRATSTASESFLGGNNTAYIEEMYRQWRHDNNSVHRSWDVYFRSGAFQAPPNLVADYQGREPGSAAPPSGGATYAAPSTGPGGVAQADPLAVKVIQMVRAFQVRGHYKARLDPLGIDDTARRGHRNPQELDLKYWGFTDADLDKKVHVGFANTKGFLDKDRDVMTVGEFYTRLTDAYSGTIGVEYMHIADVEQCNWIREKFETAEKVVHPLEVKKRVLHRLTWADHFEQFLKTKYAQTKRFGVEGGESTIAGLKAVIETLSKLGAETVVIGMPHRGRLNVLGTVVRKPVEQIFSEFAGGEARQEFEGSGDVKYHLGMSHVRDIMGKKMRMTLVANPSHLEAVDPVVVGKARAKQFYMNDQNRDRVVPILLHGDAAFAGQGVVYETLAMCDLPEYSVGGTIHMVVNNQVGFTTSPFQARSGPYCTEVAKSIQVPIFHVNGDDPEAVVRVCNIAAEWRQRFKRDIVLDVVCFRRSGHNELDEPSFTQPRMYQAIAKHPSVLKLYQEQLIKEGSLTKEEVKAMSDKINQYLEEVHSKMGSYKPKISEWLEDNWAHMVPNDKFVKPSDTSVRIETLRDIGQKICSYPADFNIHPRIKRIYEEKKETIEHEKGLDWGTAEALAFGTLLSQGYHVRLSGQDVERGTFSHRHSVLHDQKDFSRKPYVPLNHLGGTQSPFVVTNSHLSEYAVLGFELGYSYENPNALVLWEAQFGDFANGAQIIFDQFLSAGENKWRRQSGLVCLLPHGYEGQGPEHSSARLERFLQMSSEHPYEPGELHPDRTLQTQMSNWQVMNITTPANYFHALRRQVLRQYRKPLIVMSPKSLLRAKSARSGFAEMGPGTGFQAVIPETDHSLVKDSQVKRILFCSGKVYYELVEKRTALKVNDVAIVRVEQLAPFPFLLVGQQIEKYSNAQVVWVQEEPMNMGAWSHVEPRLETASGFKKRARYVGRAPSASTSAGNYNNHKLELESFLSQAFSPLPPYK